VVNYNFQNKDLYYSNTKKKAMIDKYNNSFSIFKRTRLNMSDSSIEYDQKNERLINASMASEDEKLNVDVNFDGKVIENTEELFKTSDS